MNFIQVKDSLAVYMEVNDDQAIRIRNDRNYWHDLDFVTLCGQEQGQHCVIVLLICKNGIKEIRQGLRRLQKKYKTVSFWNREHKQYFYRRRRSDNVQSNT